MAPCQEGLLAAEVEKLSMVGQRARLRPMVRALTHRNFRLFFSGQGISLIGTWMQQIAMSWLVYRITGSAILLGLVSCAAQIPAIFLAPLAGVVTDRCNRRSVLLVTQSLMMVQAFIAATLVLTGRIDVPLIVCLSLFMGLINPFDMTARRPFCANWSPTRRILLTPLPGTPHCSTARAC